MPRLLSLGPTVLSGQLCDDCKAGWFSALSPSYSDDLSCALSQNSIFFKEVVFGVFYLDCPVISFSFCVCANPCLAAESLHGQQGRHGTGARDRIASAGVAAGRESVLESCQ